MKSKTLLAMALLGANLTAFAGGDYLPPANHMLFATAEGGYTWNSVGNTSVNGFTANKSINGLSGRLAAGATHFSTDNMSYTAEMGWGYYGNMRITAFGNGIDARNDIYGFDLLVGPHYRYNQFDLFFKVGGMVENVRMYRNTNLTLLVPGGAIIGRDTTTLTDAYVLPELKVGGIYNFTNELGLSFAYDYVFGNSNVSAQITKSNAGGVRTSITTAVGGPVSLSTLMVGLQYNFA